MSQFKNRVYIHECGDIDLIDKYGQNYEYDHMQGRYYRLDHAATSGPDGALVRKRISKSSFIELKNEIENQTEEQ